ncbi:RcnB family protein [Blastomonas sp. UPD001]|uniref:RcnB family protein n=1 Tax=Blastomonas sp. UPD001 TaxID=2217673 RepID=UPI001E5AF827|nr:RcnB family protein [Blastomonas sp. UPD001]
MSQYPIVQPVSADPPAPLARRVKRSYVRLPIALAAMAAASLLLPPGKADAAELRRYDWYGWRNQNRAFFNVGRYYPPVRGWNYRRIGIGFTLGAPFFASSFWINDPWSYRLPPAYGQYRWVRYYGDVLLVDIYTGQVVDVINDFFW